MAYYSPLSSSFFFFIFLLIDDIAAVTSDLEHVLLPCQYRPGQLFTSRHLNGSIIVCLASQHLTIASSHCVGWLLSTILRDIEEEDPCLLEIFLGGFCFGLVLVVLKEDLACSTVWGEQALCPYQYSPGHRFFSKHLIGRSLLCPSVSQHLMMASSQWVRLVMMAGLVVRMRRMAWKVNMLDE